MKHKKTVACATSVLVLFSAFEVGAHTIPVHRTMTKHAFKRLDSADQCCGALIQDLRDEIMLGSWQEDGVNAQQDAPDPCRTRHHGYNPITKSTGGLFACTNLGAFLCNCDCNNGRCCEPCDCIEEHPHCSCYEQAVSAKVRARDLWDKMLVAFANGQLQGGDGVGAYHFLGRCCHLLQDVSSLPHVHPHEPDALDPCLSHPTVLEHREYESREGQFFSHENDDEFLLPEDPPLFPKDPLPADATAKLDPFTQSRLASHVYTSNEVEDFIDVAARITYFRATFWGEIEFVQDTLSSNPASATSATTSSTTFTDGTVGSQDNALHNMFDDGSGAAGVAYVNALGDDYFEITDKAGKKHTWKANGSDEWFPCDGATRDGHHTTSCSGGDCPTEEGVKITGRFFFSNPYGGPREGTPSDPVVPVKFPDGTTFSGFNNLGHYISHYSIKVGMRYNAGLILRGHAENSQAACNDDCLGKNCDEPASPDLAPASVVCRLAGSACPTISGQTAYLFSIRIDNCDCDEALNIGQVENTLGLFNGGDSCNHVLETVPFMEFDPPITDIPCATTQTVKYCMYAPQSCNYECCIVQLDKNDAITEETNDNNTENDNKIERSLVTGEWTTVDGAVLNIRDTQVTLSHGVVNPPDGWEVEVTPATLQLAAHSEALVTLEYRAPPAAYSATIVVLTTEQETGYTQTNTFVLVNPIPTASAWGLVVMILCTMTAGTLLIHRRRARTAA